MFPYLPFFALEAEQVVLPNVPCQQARGSPERRPVPSNSSCGSWSPSFFSLANHELVARMCGYLLLLNIVEGWRLFASKRPHRSLDRFFSPVQGLLLILVPPHNFRGWFSLWDCSLGRHIKTKRVGPHVLGRVGPCKSDNCGNPLP